MTTRRSSRRRKAVAEAIGRHLAMPALAASAPQAIDTDLDHALAMMASARRSLLRADVALEAILRDSTDPDEQARASVELPRVRRELELLENRRRTLVDGTATLRPPHTEDVAEAQRVADDLARVISQSGKVAAIVGLTADAVRLTEKLVA